VIDPAAPARPAAATLLVVDDNFLIRERIAGALAPAGYRVLQAEDVPGAERIIERERIDMAFLDLTLKNENPHAPLTDRGGWRVFTRLRHLAPEVSVVIVTSDTAAGTAVPLMQQGILDYVEKDSLTARGADAELQRLAEVGIARTRVGRAAPAASDAPAQADGERWIAGDTAAMREVERRIAAFAPFDIDVLILGHNGTGKDMLAAEIHRRSPRAGREMVPVNCAAISEQLLESLLFGHEKGAFTGAVERHVGLFETANGSTIFLDEIAEMSAHLQTKLLRVLQHRRILRVGGTHEIAVDVRVIAATNQNLAQALASGRLREDLYYRIATTEIVLPSLSERPGDIVRLAQHFLELERGRFNPAARGFSPAALRALGAYEWPGNVRQLRSEVISALVLSHGEAEVDVAHLSPKVTLGQLPGAAPSPSVTAQLAAGLPPVLPPDGLSLIALSEAWERRMIEQALARHGGSIAATARTLQISRDQVTHRCTKYGLDPRAFSG